MSDTPEKVGQVFVLGNDLTPIAPRTTSVTFFEDDQVRVLHFSHGRGSESGMASCPRDRVVVVASGILCLRGVESAAGKTVSLLTERGVNVNAGCAVLIPAGQSLSLSSTCGVVYTQVELPEGERAADVLKPLSPVQLDGLVAHAKETTSVELLGGGRVRLSVVAVANHARTEQRLAAGKTFLWTLGGKGAVVYKGQELPVKGGRDVVLATGDEHALAGKRGLVVALLTVLPADQQD